MNVIMQVTSSRTFQLTRDSSGSSKFNNMKDMPESVSRKNNVSELRANYFWLKPASYTGASAVFQCHKQNSPSANN